MGWCNNNKPAHEPGFVFGEVSVCGGCIDASQRRAGTPFLLQPPTTVHVVSSTYSHYNGYVSRGSERDVEN